MMTAPTPLAATVPVPPGRGRWRLTLHQRAYSAGISLSQTGLTELVDARSRRLEQNWCAPAQLTFVVDGRSPTAAVLSELTQDVVAWRWSETAGRDVQIFRGPVTQTQDTVSEQDHTVNVVCQDYLALLDRRFLTFGGQLVFTQADQDSIVANLFNQATLAWTGSGVTLQPGSFLPVTVRNVNPDGSPRGASGQLRDRTYQGQQNILEAIDNLAKSLPISPQPGQTGSFDYDIANGGFTVDDLRVFYPAQGVTRTDLALVYGHSVASLTRTVSSSGYSNYVRVLGNNNSADAATPQLYGEAWNADAPAGTTGSVGLWMQADTASDVTLQSTLNEQARGALAANSVLIPSYTLGLRPGWYRYGSPNMGDTVPLVVRSGRLNVSTTVRVLGLSYDIGDHGQEDVSIVVGRPPVTLASILTENRRTIDALARR